MTASTSSYNALQVHVSSDENRTQPPSAASTPSALSLTSKSSPSGYYRYNPYSIECVVEAAEEASQLSSTSARNTTPPSSACGTDDGEQKSPMCLPAACGAALPASPALSSAPSLPSAVGAVSANSSASKIAVPPLYEVRIRHKHGRVARYTARKEYDVDEFVMVDGDRGMDLGQVVECTLLTGSAISEASRHRVKRVALKQELDTWSKTRVQEEEEALAFAQKAVAARKIPIAVVSAEYQYDKSKLTFHYTTTESKPDFRLLLKECYRAFRCRIWLNNCMPKEDEPGTFLAELATEPTHE